MRKYYCHRCGGTSEYGEWIDDMPLQNCYWYDCGRCKASIVLDAQCDAARYVRADVALRYARMRERKGYLLASEDVDCYSKKCKHWSGMGYCREHRDCVNGNVFTYEEAQQAQQRDGKGEA